MGLHLFTINLYWIIHTFIDGHMPLVR